MIGFIDGTEACPPRNLSTGSLNPTYDVWQKKDICLLGWILASIFKRLVSTIYGLTTFKQVWTTLHNRFSSQSRSCISHLKHQLQMLTQAGKTCSAYLGITKTLVDQFTAIGKPVMIKTSSIFFWLVSTVLIPHLLPLLTLHPVTLSSHLKIFNLNF